MAPLLFGFSSQALAACARPIEETPQVIVARAKTVFVATVTASHLGPDFQQAATQPFSRSKSFYSVMYDFSVSIPIKGEPESVPFLESRALYNDPKSGRFRKFTEQSRFIPGDSILVVTSTPGPVSVSQVPLCTESMPWNSEARKVVEGLGLLPAP